MAVGRFWRTVRHLTAEQWIWRAVCRGRHQAMRFAPAASERRVRRRADRLPLPDPGRDTVAAIADIALLLETARHGDSFAGAAAGRFRLHNRDFDFGGVDRIDWRGDFDEGANPLRRMTLAYMGYAVPLLARGRADDLAAVHAILRGLVDRNPWSVPGVFRDVWNAYAASHRLINLLSGLALHRRAGAVPDPALERDLLDHVRFCAAFVRANLERDLQYNHLMKNLVALAAYGAACDSPPPPLSLLRTAVPAAIRQNFLADGGPAERSPMYHVLALLDLRMLAASCVFAGDGQAQIEAAAAKAAAALPAMTLADGDIALLNDAWLGEAPPSAEVCSAGAAGEIARLPQTGYVRLGRGGDSAVFDCGPCGPDDNPAHAHADFLSVETTVGGARFLVDTGVPTYTAGASRDRARSAAAHNGPRLAGAEPLEFWRSFRVGRRGSAGALDAAGLDGVAPLSCAGWQDGYARFGTGLRRFVGLWPGDGLLIADLWTGGRAADAAVSFRVDGAWQAAGDAGFRRDGTTVAVHALAGALAPPADDACWFRFGVERPAHRLDLAPEVSPTGARAAVYFRWGGRPPPDAPALDSLFAALAAARNAPDS